MYKGQPWTIADTRRHSELSRPSRPRFGGTGPGSSDRPWGGLCARQPLPCAVVLRLQTGLTANLHGFRICELEGWPLLQRHARALALTCGVKGHQAGAVALFVSAAPCYDASLLHCASSRRYSPRS